MFSLFSFCLIIFIVFWDETSGGNCSEPKAVPQYRRPSFRHSVSGAFKCSIGVPAVLALALFGTIPPKNDPTRRMYQITSHSLVLLMLPTVEQLGLYIVYSRTNSTPCSTNSLALHEDPWASTVYVPKYSCLAGWILQEINISEQQSQVGATPHKQRSIPCSPGWGSGHSVAAKWWQNPDNAPPTLGLSP